MRRPVFASCGLTLSLVLASAAPLHAQGSKNAEKVRFTTVDGVEIHGSFFAASKRTPPTVLLLHALGEDSKSKGWTTLAEELQAKGYAVLSFDFRGHGDSKDVDAVFWQPGFTYNKAYVKSKNPAAIDFKDFDKRYYPVLVNDIASAKAFLDRKNDTGACNTANFIIIGAETGATLGALWLNSEWYRYKMIQPTMFGFPPKPDTRPEGKDVISCIFLSVNPQLGAKKLTLSSLLDTPVRQGATPTLFLYGTGDKDGEKLATALEKVIKGTSKDKDKFALTKAFGVPDTDLKGAGLLQKSLGTATALSDYLGQVVQEKNNEWIERDFRKTQYVWRFGPKLVPARVNPNEMNLAYDTYEKFIPK